MESIGSKSQRMSKEAADDLEQEEGGVDGDHDLDTGALGPRHLREAHGAKTCSAERRVADGSEDQDWSIRPSRGRKPALSR